MKWFRIIVVVIISIVVLMFLVGAILPEEHTATVSADFKSSAEDVWAVVADVEGAPSWRQGVKEQLMTSRKTFLEVTMDGDSIEYLIEESIPGKSYVTTILTASLPYGGSWSYEFIPNAEGCTVRITEHGEVYNPMFRFLSRYAIGHTATMENYLEELKARIQ